MDSDASVIEHSVQGLKELDDALANFPVLLQRKVLRGGLRAGLKPVAEAAREGIRSISGDLAKSVRVGTVTRNGVPVATVKAGNSKAFYAHFVEFGTAAHFIGPSSKRALSFLGADVGGVHHPGAQKKPFMRPALDKGMTVGLQAFADYMTKRIQSETIKSLEAAPDESDGTPR